MRHGQRGYVLITVLASLVLITVVAARLDERVGLFRESQRAWDGWARSQGLLAAARDELLLAIGTRQLSQQGFGAGPGALRVDGRAYRLPSGVRVSVQDTRGLISVATPDPLVLRNFLLQRGVADGEVEPLLDKLADYSDTDDLRRLNGAEATDYRELGMAPPRNDWPISPYEVRLIPGWAERPQLWLRAGDFLTASREPWINPNSAPGPVLAALPGATPEGVAALLARRELQLFVSAAEVAALTGIRLPDEPVAFFPGRFYRLRLWLEDGPGAMEYHIILTPAASRLPWQILETRLVDRPAQSIPDAEIAPFPLALVESADGSR